MQDSNLSSTQNSHDSTKKTLPPNLVLNKVEERMERVCKDELRLCGGRSSSQKKGTIYALLFFILAILGFADATYLTVKNLQGEYIVCSLTHGCDIVTSSPFAEIFGIPVALFGALYYLTVLLLSVLFLDKKKEQTLRIISKLTCIGLGASLYFMFIQAFVLRAWCQYCIGSAITSMILFVIGMVYLKKSSTKLTPTNSIT